MATASLSAPGSECRTPATTEQTQDQPGPHGGGRGLPERYLSRCHSRASSRRATAGRLLAAFSWAAPERLGDPATPGRDQASLTELHSAPPVKRSYTTLINSQDKWLHFHLGGYFLVEFVFLVHSDLIEGKRVSIEDVIKAVVGVKSGFSKCGNHDASPGSTRH